MPGGCVTSATPRRPPVLPASARCSKSEPIAQVPRASPGLVTTTVSWDSPVLCAVIAPPRHFVRRGFGLSARLGPVPRQVKSRAYDASRRRAQAEDRKQRVLAAAGRLFVDEGYAGTSMTEVARRAGVALDTVYALVGRKPEVLLAVHDLLLGEGAV